MVELNLDQARYNMIEQQIRPWDVLDAGILKLLAETPREEFVPEAHRALAFSDLKIPLKEGGVVMMNPNVEGRILQALQIQPTDKALEIGTGSGFLTACLAHLASHVTSVEIDPELADAARARLQAHGINNATVECGDARSGWGDGERFDVIAVTGAIAEMTLNYREMIAVGGRMFAIMGQGDVLEACLVTRVAETQWHTESLFETHIPYLKGMEPASSFEF
ncbi:MAG: protein-L-isoaspartate O-methyltransferase family protein [Gammaproteobacteria bacterium]